MMNARQRNRLIDCLVSGILAYVAGIIIAHILKPTEAGIWITAMTALVWITTLNVWRGVERRKTRERAFRELDAAFARAEFIPGQRITMNAQDWPIPTRLLAASAEMSKLNADLIENMLEQAHIAPEDRDQYKLTITPRKALLTRCPSGQIVSCVHLVTAEELIK